MMSGWSGPVTFAGLQANTQHTQHMQGGMIGDQFVWSSSADEAWAKNMGSLHDDVWVVWASHLCRPASKHTVHDGSGREAVSS